MNCNKNVKQIFPTNYLAKILYDISGGSHGNIGMPIPWMLKSYKPCEKGTYNANETL